MQKYHMFSLHMALFASTLYITYHEGFLLTAITAIIALFEAIRSLDKL